MKADDLELSALLPRVVALAREAGERILEVYRTEFEVQTKGDDSPLTQADLAAHRAIVAGLQALTPALPVLSEESARIPFAERAGWRRYWLVDPLDGTREFVKRNGEFTVNIALIDAHEAVLGVVGVPVKGLCYYAHRGGGAWRAQADGAAQPIHARPLPSGTLTVAGSRSHAGASLQAFLERLGPYELVSMGSALKSCLVAEGKADVYPRLGPTSEWDTAAAQAVVEEAGGHVTDTAMRPLRYNTKDSLLNPHFFVYGANDVNWAGYLEGAPSAANGH